MTNSSPNPSAAAGFNTAPRPRFIAWTIDLACGAAPLLPLPFLQWESAFNWPSFYRGAPGGAWGGLDRALYTFAAVLCGVSIVVGLNTITVIRHRCTLGMAYAGLSISGVSLWRWALSYFVAGPLIAGAVGYAAMSLDSALGSGWRAWDLPDHADTWLLFVGLWLFAQALPLVGRQRRTLLDHLSGAHPAASKLSDYGRYSRERFNRADALLLGSCVGVLVISITDIGVYLPCFVGGLLGFGVTAAVQIRAYRTRGGMLIHLARSTARE